MIKLIARIVLFPLQFLAFGLALFFFVLWLQSESVDGAAVRAAIRDALSRQTGHAVSMGEVEVKFSWPPRVVIKDLRIPNRRGGSKRPMLQVPRVVANLNPYHMIVGGRTIDETVFVNPEILVERGRDGRINWGRGRGGPAAILVRAARIIGSRKVVISGGRLIVRDLGRGSTIVVPLLAIDLETRARPQVPVTAAGAR